MKVIGRLALVLVLCAGSLLAQRGFGRGGMGGRTRTNAATPVTEEDTVNLFVVLLDLNDSQKQQLSTILDSAIQTAGPIQEQLNKTKQSLFEAAKAGASDAEINKAADQQGSLSSQMLALQTRSFAKVFSLLTSEQKAKTDSFLYERIGALLASPIKSPASVN
jgi:Spy/CpxP family protein refolding chaperone